MYVAVKAHLAEVVWEKTVNKKLKISVFGSFGPSGPPQVCKFLIINGELLGSIIVNALLLEPITRKVSAATLT